MTLNQEYGQYKDKAKNLVEQYGDNNRFIGINGNHAVYSYVFSNNERI